MIVDVEAVRDKELVAGDLTRAERKTECRKDLIKQCFAEKLTAACPRCLCIFATGSL